MTPLRSTHPCPSCGAGVALTARFCGACGTPLQASRDRASRLRAELSDLVGGFRANQTLSAAMLEAMNGLATAPARPIPRVVIVGELGRGSRALANRLAGSKRLSSGPSQRGAAAVLDAETRTASSESILDVASIEVAPPLAAGAETTAEGVIPALMRADVVVFALSAAQLLSATERRLLTGLSSLTAAPIALAVGRMDVVETDEDLDDIVRRAGRFRDTLEPSPEVFLLPSDTDDAPRLQHWIRTRLDAVSHETDAAWIARVEHLLSGATTLLDTAHQTERTLPELETLLATLLAAHEASRAAARTQLEDGLSTIRDALAERMGTMTPEQRIHEGASELVVTIEALLRESVGTWRAQLSAALTDADLPAGSIPTADASSDTVGAVTGDAPRLTTRLPDQSYGLIAAAVGVSVGVLMLPAGGSGVVAIGLGLTAGSVAAARVLHDRRGDRLRTLHAETLDSWLREVGVRAEDWMLDHLEQAHGQVAERLTELHQHATQHRAHTSADALRAALDALRTQLREPSHDASAPHPPTD